MKRSTWNRRFCTTEAINMMMLMLLLGVLSETINGMKLGLCGPGMVAFNFETQDCVDNVVVTRGTSMTRVTNMTKERISMCGIPPMKINLNTHVCRDGIKVPINETSTQKPKTQPSTPPPAPSSTLLPDNRNPRHICPSDNVPEGYACCVSKAYRPAVETCCIITGTAYYQVLHGAESEHVCCRDGETMTSTLYKRGSLDVPCQHASTNNKLLGKGLSLKRAGSKMCNMKFSHVFKFDIDRQKIPADSSEFSIHIKGWENLRHLDERRPIWRQIKNDYSSDMRGKLDKYIPRKNKFIQRKTLRLKKKCFLVFTNKNYNDDAVFFLKKNEILFKCPKKWQSIKKILRKLNKKC